MKTMFKWIFLLISAIVAIGSSSLAINFYWPKKAEKILIPQLIPNRITCRLTCAKGTVSLDIPVYEDNPVVYDNSNVFLPYLVDGAAQEGVAPGSNPSLTVITHGKKKALRFYQLTGRVKKVSARFKKVEEGELRVMNESPYKIELWLNSDDDVILDFDVSQEKS